MKLTEWSIGPSFFNTFSCVTMLCMDKRVRRQEAVRLGVLSGGAKAAGVVVDKAGLARPVCKNLCRPPVFGIGDPGAHGVDAPEEAQGLGGVARVAQIERTQGPVQ